MSASTERKNRMAAKADGTHKKTLAAQKEEEKKRKERIKWIAVGIIIFVCLAAIIYLNTGVFYRNTTAVSVDISAYESDDISIPAEKVDFSIAQVNYLFRFNYSNFMSQYGSMASYLGLDSSTPLKSQPCMMGGTEDEGYTWYDYFMDSTVAQMKSYATTCAYAKAAGIELSDEAKTEIDEAVDTLTASAKEGGYSLNGYLAYVYGKGCNESVFRSILEMEYIAMAVQDTVTGAKDYSAEEITAHYAEIADDYDFYSYSYYLVAAETGEANEDGTVPAPTEDAMAAAKADAEKIMNAAKNGDLEGAVVAVLGEEVIPQPEETATDDTAAEEDSTANAPTASTAKTDVQGKDMETELAEWLKSADRKAGDVEVIEVEGQGYYVVMFTQRHTETEATEESGEVPYCDYISEQVLREGDLNAWSESVYAPIMEGVTADNRFGARYVK